MSKTSDYILNRLSSILPLPARLAALPRGLQAVYRAFLVALIEKGRILTDAELASLAPGGDAFAALWTLRANDLIVNDAAGKPIGAYPVTLERTPHRVRVDGHDLYAMCAFDAVSVAPMFGKRVESWTRCPITGMQIHIVQDDTRVLKVEPGPDVQLGVWWREPYACAARNFCPGIVATVDRASALAWQAGRTEDHEFASLEDAIDVGLRFFRPLAASEKFTFAQHA